MVDLRKSLTTTEPPKDGEKEKSLGKALQIAASTSTTLTPQRPDQRALQATAKKIGHLGGIIDATASRSDAWEESKKIQAEMFTSVQNVGDMRMRIILFGGDQLSVHNWEDNPHAIARAIRATECVGGSTQFIPAFRVFLADKNRADSIMMIGDSFEEKEVDMIQVAHDLKARGIKVFAFHEGTDFKAEMIFRQIAEITGGAFAKFGPQMPLSSLCRAVAVYTAGGQSALDRMVASGDKAAAAVAGEKIRIAGPTPPKR